MDTDSFIINIKTGDVYEDIANDVEKRFDTSNYEVKNYWIDKRWIRRKDYNNFVAIWPKTYSYLMDNGNSDKKAKGIKKSVIKRIINLMIIKNAY